MQHNLNRVLSVSDDSRGYVYATFQLFLHYLLRVGKSAFDHYIILFFILYFFCNIFGLLINLLSITADQENADLGLLNISCLFVSHTFSWISILYFLLKHFSGEIFPPYSCTTDRQDHCPYFIFLLKLNVSAAFEFANICFSRFFF